MAHPTRPTLPPLHTLDLPPSHITSPLIHQLYDMDDMSRWNPQHKRPNCHQRHPGPYPTPPSPASPRTPSPPASCLRPRTNASTSPQTPTTPAIPFPARKVRLVPTSFEHADAVVLVPPPAAPDAPPPQPLLLVGPALARLRRYHPQRPLAKGARIHPYRIARPSDRRPPAGPAHATA